MQLSLLYDHYFRSFTSPQKETPCLLVVSIHSCLLLTFGNHSSLLSVIRVVSYANLRLLIFLLAVLIPACDSFGWFLHVMYSAYKLNKEGDSIQPWLTAFPIWNQSVVPCPVLTVAFWPAYRFLRRQVRWSGIPIFWRVVLSLLWSTQSKGLV